MYRRIALAAIILWSLCAALSAWCAPYQVQGNRVLCGRARFEVLAADTIRMQWTTEAFVDAPTAVVTNRGLQYHEFAVRADGQWLRLTTPALQLRYRLDSGRFSSENLRASWREPNGYHEWAPGTTDEENLGGPVSSFNAILDHTRPEGTLPPFPPGFLSKAGYFLLDDSRTPVWNAATDWIEPRPGSDGQDWYLFVYGRDFARFFARYIQLTGRIPLVPRYALGAWVTDLNFEYTNEPVQEQDLFAIVERFRRERIPLDVFVLDFAWHPYGWDGSLDWSPFIADPEAFLRRMALAGLRVSLNDHPASGLSDRDSRAAASRRALGLPAPEELGRFDISNDWLWRDDPNNVGQAEGWEKATYDDSGWRQAPTPGPWENFGLPGYDGYVWYRRWFDLPDTFAGQPVYLSCGGVDDEYDLYVNGQLVKHWGGPGASVYNQRTTTNITDFVTVPGRNLITLRVLDWGNQGGLVKPLVLVSDLQALGDHVRFNLADQRHADLYMQYHHALLDQGVAFWWIDGDSAAMEGLDSQMWTNRVYYDYQQRHTGQRSLIFSRYGGPGSHRYPAFFTADCYSNWKVLAWEVPYTIKAGNVLVPYVTHDIGGFMGTLRDDFELYARWLQFGALSPLLRLHSAHANPEEGNPRLPWVYGDAGIEMARRFFQLRYALIPYLYTYCREAYDTGLPMCRGLYLECPDEPEAYRFDEYLLGRELLVAPITSPAVNGRATRSLWLPPGEWFDWFTGEKYPGGRTVVYECPLERMPLFVRAGSILPLQPEMPHTGAQPVDPLILVVYPGAEASFTVYEDDGLSLDYMAKGYRRTPIKLARTARGWRLTIGAPVGDFAGATPRQAYEVRFHSQQGPPKVTLDGTAVRADWSAGTRMATVVVPAAATRRTLHFTW